MKHIYIASMGVAGVFSRYVCDLLVDRLALVGLPFSTLFVNVVGSFLIGIEYVASVDQSFISPDLRLGLTVGFLGGFTTFSSYSLQCVRLIEQQRYLAAGSYLVGSPLLGVGATLLGIVLTRIAIRGGV